MGSFYFTVLIPMIVGAFVIAIIGVMRRATFLNVEVSAIQFLIASWGCAASLFAAGYLVIWGWELPTLLPGFWKAVIGGSLANVVIWFCNAKAASIDKGELSLTAPLQAMTPGLITLLAIVLGEYPGKLGIGGIFLMITGSYILLWPTTPKRWYEYFGPISKVLLIVRWKHLPADERNKALVVALALGSAAMGTFGLLFDGLYTRRGVNMQGLTLGSMALAANLTMFFIIWHRVRPDSTPEQRIVNLFRKETLKYPLVFAGLWVLHLILIYPTFQHTLVAYTGTLKRLSIIWSVLLGYWLFHEEEFKKRMWAAAFIVGGAVLISFDGVVGSFTDKLQSFGF